MEKIEVINFVFGKLQHLGCNVDVNDEPLKKVMGEIWDDLNGNNIYTAKSALHDDTADWLQRTAILALYLIHERLTSGKSDLIKTLWQEEKKAEVQLHERIDQLHALNNVGDAIDEVKQAIDDLHEMQWAITRAEAVSCQMTITHLALGVTI